MSQTNNPVNQPEQLAIVKNDLPTLTAILALNSAPGTDVATIAAQEFQYLEQQALAKPELLQCQPQSVLLGVKSVMRKNLSLDPNAGLVYIKTRSVNVGSYNSPKWIKVLEVQETANGLISINRQLGRILDYTNPLVTKDAAGKVIAVSMEILKPSYKEPRWEKYEFDESDFMRWRRASHKENSRSYKSDSGKPVPNNETLNYANPNYTNWKGGIDPEFARAKCIRHSLKKLGTNINESRYKVFDVPRDRVVDPNVDAIAAEEENGFTPHEEVSTHVFEEPAEPINQPTNDLDIPNADDL